MCCQDEERLDLPAAVIEALAHYRRLVDERGWDWGDEGLPDLFRWARFSRVGDVMAAVAVHGDWAAAVRDVADARPDAGVVRIAIDAAGAVAAHPGPRRLAVAGRPTALDVVVDSSADREVTVTLDGRALAVAAHGAVVDGVAVDGARPVITVDGREHAVVDVVRATELTLRADDWSRWSVVDATGGAWFPDGVPAKWDGAHRPFFHARGTTLVVPAAPLTITCARGPEFAPAEVTVDPEAQPMVALFPRRTHDPRAEGWFGADLHVHLNYSGDLVVAPEQAQGMQRGEGLDLLNLTAGNLAGAHVYDRVLFEETVGDDLWHDGDHVARAGVEFRNDLLGHVHGLGLTSPPVRYQSGHAGSDHPHDWPPNAVACADLRDRDASVAYAHPVFAPFGATGDDGDEIESMFAIARMPEARELVVDAALGLVDAVDLVHCWDPRPTTVLYHRLLGCGLRPAATAGSDVFLSFAHGPGAASNPPGWGRVYADLAGAPLSVPAFRDAVRAGRTVATNGPFLTLDVDGRGPGATVAAQPGDRLGVHVACHGPVEGTLRLVGPDGTLAEVDASGEHGRLDTEVVVDGPGWLAATVVGGPHPLAPEQPIYAHTSPVHVEVAGARIARARDARWCLALIDRLERHLQTEGRFDADPARRAEQLADHADVLDRARAVYRALL